MAKYWEFEVQGSGVFPHDMLRYDACYPVRPADVYGLSSSYNDMRSREFLRDIRRVRLASTVKPPTEDRWKSFGWVVARVEVRSR